MPGKLHLGVITCSCLGCLHLILTLRVAMPPILSPSKGQPSLTTMFSCQHPFERLATSRRQASTKATPVKYKPAASSSKKSIIAPSTGFAAIGSYNTIARRWTAIMVGIPFVVVTSYLLYQRVVLGQEQKSLEAPPEGPLVAKHG